MTPLSAEELVWQKLAGVRRLMGVLSVPFVTLIVFQAIWNAYVVRSLSSMRNNNEELSLFLHDFIGLSLATLVYLPLVQWIAFHCTLRLRNQIQAVLTAITIVIVFCVVPMLFLRIAASSFWGEWVPWLSPVRVLFHRQIVQSKVLPSGLFPLQTLLDSRFIGLSLHFCLAAGLLFLLRRHALRSFSACVGRTEPDKSASYPK